MGTSSELDGKNSPNLLIFSSLLTQISQLRSDRTSPQTSDIPYSEERMLDDFDTMQQSIQKSKSSIHNQQAPDLFYKPELKSSYYQSSNQDTELSSSDEEEKTQQHSRSRNQARDQDGSFIRIQESKTLNSNDESMLDQSLVQQGGNENKGRRNRRRRGRRQQPEVIAEEDSFDGGQDGEDFNSQSLKIIQECGSNPLSGRTNEDNQTSSNTNQRSQVLSMNPLENSGFVPGSSNNLRSSQASVKSQKIQNALRSINESFNMPNLEMAPESNQMYSEGQNRSHQQSQDDISNVKGESHYIANNPPLLSTEYRDRYDNGENME